MRYDIGVENMMFGSDYPHVEGTWPRTYDWVAATLGGIPEDEQRLILGANAARLYDFDLDELEAIAQRVGIPVPDLAERYDSPRPRAHPGRPPRDDAQPQLRVAVDTLGGPMDDSKLERSGAWASIVRRTGSSSSASPGIALVAIWVVVVSIMMLRAANTSSDSPAVTASSAASGRAPRRIRRPERVGPARRRRARSRSIRGGDRGEHRIRRTRQRWAVVVDDLDVEAWSVLRAQDTERPDGEVVDLARLRVDGQALVEHPADRHVRGADRVRAQHDLVERITGGDAHVIPAMVPSSAMSTRAPASACAPIRTTQDARIEHDARDTLVAREGASIDTGFVERGFDEHRVLGEPDGRGALTTSAGPGRGARPLPTSSMGTATPSARRTDRRPRRRCPSSRPCRRRTRHSRRSAAASGRAARRSRDRTTRHGRRPVGECAGRVADPSIDLAAERAAVGQRRRGLAAGSAPRRVGLEVRGLDPAGGEAHAAAARLRELERRPGLHRGAPTLHLPRARAGHEQRLGHDPVIPAASTSRRGRRQWPALRAGRDRDQRVTRRRVVGEPSAPRGTPGPTSGCTAFERCPLSRGGEITSRELAPAGTALAVSIASYTVCHPVHRHRCAASARSKSTLRSFPSRAVPPPARRCPACRTRTASRRSRRRPRPACREPGVEAVDGRHRTTGDPGGRGHAGDPWVAVDEHRAAPALPLGHAAVLHRDDAEALAQHGEQRLARGGVTSTCSTVHT